MNIQPLHINSGYFEDVELRSENNLIVINGYARKEVSNYIGANYLNPEEYDINYHLDIIDVKVFDMDYNEIDITEQDIQDIEDKIKFNLTIY